MEFFTTLVVCNLCGFCTVALLTINSSTFRRITIHKKAIISALIPNIVCGVLYFSYATYYTTDTEYFGGYATKAEYFEDWDERVSCRHEISCSHTCTSGSGNNKTTYNCHSNDGYYHSYDVDYHPPEWMITDSNNAEFSVGVDTYDKLAKRWNNSKKIELNRSYHSNDGDKFVTVWDGLDSSIEDTTKPHLYENKIPVSNSLLKFREVSREEARAAGLFDYPPVNNYFQEVILSSMKELSQSSHPYRLINAKLGRKKQVRVYVIVFVNKPLSISYDQEAYLQGGNKNEVIITVGIDESKKQLWGRAFSYAFTLEKNKVLEAEINTKLNSYSQIDLTDFGNWLYSELDSKFVRREFTPINKELAIEYPPYLVVLCAVLSIAGILTMCIIAKKLR